MATRAGVRRDFQVQEQRRLRGARLLRNGVPQSEISTAGWGYIGTWSAVGHSNWRQKGGLDAKSRLGAEDLEEDRARAEALGYETALWTVWRVAHLIEEECGSRLACLAGLAHSAAGGMNLSASHWARLGAERREDPGGGSGRAVRR